MLDVVSPVLGAGLALLVAWDVTITLLHPTARGPLSYLANRVTWIVIRALSLRALGGRALSYAGPLAVAGNVLAWVLVLWIAFAFVYLPFIDAFSFDPNTPFDGPGLVEALYVSGVTVTTVGFGDVVATGDLLRLTMVVEAASGFGALSASIAYVLSVYPLTTELRSTGLQLADYGVLELSGAVRMVRESGPSALPTLARGMTECHEHLRRFPVLYFFESGDDERPLSSLIRGVALLVVALRCANPGAVPHAPTYADVFELILARLLDDLERDFVGGRRRGAPSADRDQPEHDVRSLCASVDPQFASHSEIERASELQSLLARAETVLAAVAEEHGHPATALFAEH
ncbi:MAG: potassium channel family protein [Actinomycetota bacterium]|nr:potassium channel family protein [Actinomycetota bacterium]